MALTAKRKAFIEHYLQCWNASEAARRAGYSPRSAGSIGHENLNIPEIRQEIERRKQDLLMSADEALIRLTEHARGDMGDFIRLTPEGPVLDLNGAAAQGKTRLIRKLKTKHRTYVEQGRGDDDDTVVTEIDTEFELYNAQSALELIGKSHQMFIDRIEHTGETIVRVRYDDEGTDGPSAEATSQTV